MSLLSKRNAEGGVWPLPLGPLWHIHDPDGKVLPVTGIISLEAMLAAVRYVYPDTPWAQEYAKWEEMKADGYRCVARWAIHDFDDRLQISQKEWVERDPQCACDDWRADMCVCDGTCSCHWEMKGERPELPRRDQP